MARPTVVLLITLMGVGSLLAQNTSTSAVTVVRDPQGITLLNQSLTAVVGTAGLSTYQDFTAIGTITYYWGGDPVSGAATIRGRGSAEFRIDASLPVGSRTYAVANGMGALREVDGTLKPIPLHNTANVGILNFPYPTVAAALASPLASITFVRATTVNGRAAYQVQVQQNFSSIQDPDGTLSGLCVTNYFVDSQSQLIVMVQDMTHPNQTMTENYVHEIDLEDYSSTNGFQFPMSVIEKVGGQTTWKLRLSSIEFNTGLTDQDFVLQ